MTPLLVALGAALGAPLRYWLGARFDAGAWPRGTFLANTSGSLALGVLVGLSLDGDALALLGVGFCGAFTTWSTLAVQTHDLGVRRGGPYVLTTTGVALVACAAGFWLGAQVGAPLGVQP